MLDSVFNDALSSIFGDSLDLSVEPQVLLDCQEWEDCVMLWAIANELSSLIKVIQNIEAGNRDLTFRRYNISRQTLERR